MERGRKAKDYIPTYNHIVEGLFGEILWCNRGLNAEGGRASRKNSRKSEYGKESHLGDEVEGVELLRTQLQCS
jgi:hypothetical protein